MGQLVRSMDWLRERWQATVLAVHHTRHEASDRARGSSSFRAALDSEFLIKPNDAEVLLSATKAKDWTKPANTMLRKVSVPVEIVGTDGQPLRDSSLVLQSSVQASMDEVKRRQVLQMRSGGAKIREIATQLGLPKTNVERILKAPGDE